MKDAIIVMVDDERRKHPLCRKHQKAIAKLLQNSGLATEVFIPPPSVKPRQ